MSPGDVMTGHIGTLTLGQNRARFVALAVPALLLAGAWGSQLFGGLYPCEMCHWQRWPHYGAVAFAILSFVVPVRGAKLALVAGAAALIAISGLIGLFHAGVEYHWWQGITACSTMVSGAGIGTDEMLRRILAAPVIRCDAAQWRLAGISLAGWNAIFSLTAALAIGMLLRRKRA